MTYHVGDVPAAGPAMQYLEAMVDGSAIEEERTAFVEAWHGRVHAVLTADEFFSVQEVG